MTLVLVVEDEAELARVIRRELEAAGHRVLLAEDGEAALGPHADEAPDAVVLDWMLPGIDGLEVLRRMRGGAPTPVLMLTARGEEADLVLGLEVGADDYLTKPFSVIGLVARVRAMLRREELVREALAADREGGGDLAKNRATPARSEDRQDGGAGNMRTRASKRNGRTVSGGGVRKAFLSALLASLLAAALLAAPAAAQRPEGEPIYESREGAGYEVYEDGTIIIGGDVRGSCDTVLESILRGPLEPTRETYRQVEACEEAGFQVPGSESLPETGGPSLPVVAVLGLILACALCLLATRRAGPLGGD